MQDKEQFYNVQESYDQMMLAQQALADTILKLVQRRIESLGEGCIRISLVIPEQRDSKKKPGTLVEYIEMDRIWVSEDGTVQLSGFIEDMDDLVMLHVTELDIHELYALMHILFDENGTVFEIIPLDEAS